jgi:hypothetical protein
VMNIPRGGTRVGTELMAVHRYPQRRKPIGNPTI